LYGYFDNNNKLNTIDNFEEYGYLDFEKNYLNFLKYFYDYGDNYSYTKLDYFSNNNINYKFFENDVLYSNEYSYIEFLDYSSENFLEKNNSFSKYLINNFYKNYFLIKTIYAYDDYSNYSHFFDYTVDYDNLLIYSDFYNKFEEPIESDLSDIDYFLEYFESDETDFIDYSEYELEYLEDRVFDFDSYEIYNSNYSEIDFDQEEFNGEYFYGESYKDSYFINNYNKYGEFFDKYYSGKDFFR
jgi:hypothetical protein